MSEVKIYVTESHTRTWIKSISWRLLGTATTFCATFSITNSLDIATAVGAIELIAKTFLYYVHERIWIRINNII